MDAVYAIPPRVRRATLSILDSWSAAPDGVVAAVGEQTGFVTLGDVIEAVHDQFGVQAMRDVAVRLHEHMEARGERFDSNQSALSASVSVLLSVPDAWFLMAIKAGTDHAVAYAFELHRAGEAHGNVVSRVSELFAGNGVPYGYDGNGELVPTGSPTLSQLVFQPALDVLRDPRLARALEHLLEARRRLEEPDPPEAVDEARMAVEHGMLALLDALGVPRPARRQPQDLFNALTAAGMPADAQEIVLGAARFRGRTEAGHSGGAPVSQGEAEAAVASAASALRYLADRLP